MKILLNTLVMTLLLGSSISMAAPKIGEPAPDFELKDSLGKTHKLSDYTKKGKFVVLEWFNHECPYVKKHYTLDEKYKDLNMQHSQKKMKDEGVIWLSINSTNMDQDQFKDAKKTNELIKATKTQAHAVLIDSTSAVGKLYEAKTTPHMFVINPKGIVVYMGAIDDNDSSNVSALNGAKNYVLQAVASAKANREIATIQSKPYGCGVKYSKK